jgi:cytochrome c oxidase assembly protein subunit 15
LNSHIDVEAFKSIYYIEWSHRILGRSIGILFLGPMAYFWMRGYLLKSLKRTLMRLFLIGGVQGAIGWWMVKSGLVNKEETNELDKTPNVSPYRLALHAGFAYVLYGVFLWQSMHLLRRP